MSKRTKIILAVVALVVVGAVVAAIALGGKGSGPEVETAKVTKQELAVTVTASGKVESGVSSDIFPPAAGTLEKIYVSDGETVTAGQKIAQMDTAPLELQVKQAKSGLAQAKSALANLGAQTTNSDDIAAATSNVTASKQAVSAAQAAEKAALTQYNNASKAYDSAAAVLPSNSATLSALAAAEQQAYAGYLNAKSGTTRAKSGVDAAESALRKAKAVNTSSQRAAAQAAVTQANAAVQLAEDALDKATLVAPVDGTVLFNAAGVSAAGAAFGKPTDGSAVSPQAAPFSVVDLGAMKFSAEVDEADIERVQVGMKVKVTLDSFPGDEFESTITRINPAAQPTATGGTVFVVEMALTDTGKDIFIGMKGDAVIEVSSRGSALTIPVEALFSEGGTDYVYVVSNGTLKKTEITVGATTDTEVEVLQGLSEGDVVALSGSTQYTDGMAVRVKTK